MNTKNPSGSENPSNRHTGKKPQQSVKTDRHTGKSDLSSSKTGRRAGKAGNTSSTKAKRIIAWIAIILLAGLYIMTFISALLARPGAGRLFRFCLGMTIAVPIFAWICIWAVGVLSHRHTIASMDLLNSNPDARREMEDGIRKEMEDTVRKGTKDADAVQKEMEDTLQKEAKSREKENFSKDSSPKST